MNKDFLPSGWVSRTLEDVVEINPRLDKKLFSDDMDISFVPMSAVETENGKIDISEIRSFGDVKKCAKRQRQSEMIRDPASQQRDKQHCQREYFR